MCFLGISVWKTQIWVKPIVFWGKRKSLGLLKAKATGHLRCLVRIMIDSDARSDIFALKK